MRHPRHVAEEPMSDEDLDAIEQRAAAASKGPWRSFVEGRDQSSGDNFIRVGGVDDDKPDMYVWRDGTPATAADQDFIACARQDVPRLVAEVRRLRGG